MSRQSIPAEIKRSVRQRCGFGCVICGIPFYEYEHIEEYSKNGLHEEANLTLLCPTHHALKTRGLIRHEQVQQSNANPFNSGAPKTAPLIIPDTREFSLLIGAVDFRISSPWPDAAASALMINGRDYITVHRDEGLETISAVFTDETGRAVTRIERGELTLYNNVWDHDQKGSIFRSRRGPGQIDVEFQYQAGHLKITRANFFDAFSLDGFKVDNNVLTMRKRGADSLLKGAAFRGLHGIGIWNYMLLPDEGRPTGFGMMNE